MVNSTSKEVVFKPGTPDLQLSFVKAMNPSEKSVLGCLQRLIAECEGPEHVTQAEIDAIVQLPNIHRIYNTTDPSRILNAVINSRNVARSSANAKLSALGQQMDQLVEQARKVVLKYKRDEHLHRNVACNFVKRLGSTYYLYVKPETNYEFFSILSPQDWGPSLKAKYLGAYRLEPDHSFCILDKEDVLNDQANLKYQRFCTKPGP